MSESLTLAQLKEQPHYSYSALNMYINICQLQYLYRYVAKLEPEQTPVALPFGSAYHAALSEQAQAAKHGKLLPASELTDVFVTYFKAAVADSAQVIYKDGQDNDSLIQLAARMLDATTAQWPDYFGCIKGVAVPFSFHIQGLSKPVIGEFDMLLTEPNPFDKPDEEPPAVIVDWKTSARSWPEGREDKELQASIYTAAYESAHGIRPDFRYDITTKAKTPKIERRYTSRSTGQLARMEKLLLEADKAIQAEVFMPNETSFACADCPYAGACQSWHRPFINHSTLSTNVA